MSLYCSPGASASTADDHPLAWLAPQTPPGAAPRAWYRVAEPRRAFVARLLAQLLAAGPDMLDAAVLPAVCGALMRVEAAPVPMDGANEVMLIPTLTLYLNLILTPPPIPEPCTPTQPQP